MSGHFPHRQVYTEYGSGNEANGLTLMDHILSANPHPNQDLAGGGSGSAGELTDRFNQHIAGRTQSSTGEVTNSPHVDQDGKQLFAGSRHRHDGQYADYVHQHDELYSKLGHTHDSYVTREQLYAALGKDGSESADVVSPTSDITYHDGTEKVKTATIDYNTIIKNATYLIDLYQYRYYATADDTTTKLQTITVANGPVTESYPHELRMVYGRSRDESTVKYLSRQTVTTADGRMFLRSGTAELDNGLTKNQLSMTVNLVVRVNGISAGVIELSEQNWSVAGTYVYDSDLQVYKRRDYPVLDAESGAVLYYEPFASEEDVITTMPDGSELIHPYLILASKADTETSCRLNFRYNSNSTWLYMEDPIPIPAFDSKQDLIAKQETYATYFADSPLLAFVGSDKSVALTLTAETTRNYEYVVNSFTYSAWQAIQ